MAKEYWADRNAHTQLHLITKGVKETNAQLKSYYLSSMKKVLGQFEETYIKLLSDIGEGREATPADLYKLDKYWQMQNQLKVELQKLGDKQAALLSKRFVKQFIDVYESLSLPTSSAFGTADLNMAQQMINQIWCADGKSWSSRIWSNTEDLAETLNEQLIHCVVSGKKTTELKNLLQERFEVSYHRADSIVRTEMAHIQTEAARQRYLDAGVKEVEIWADEDERRCDKCGNLHEKRFPVFGNMPIPAHPNCRCCIVPVIEDDSKEIPLTNKKENSKIEPQPKVEKQTPPLNIEEPVRLAIEKTKEIQDKELHFFRRSKSHQNHAEELTGLSGDEAWAVYEKMAEAFLKQEIDGKIVEGFVSEDGWMFKFNNETNMFGILSDKGTISTLFIPDKEKYGCTPKEYWKIQIGKYWRKK